MGFADVGGDCDDNNANVQDKLVCYADEDNDGVGDNNTAINICSTSCVDAGDFSEIPDSACPDSLSDSDVDAWVVETLTAQCIQENRDYTTEPGVVQCTNTGTSAQPKHRKTQVWTITLKPAQILMGQATSCYATALPTVPGTWKSERLPDDTNVVVEGTTADMPQLPYYNSPSSSQLEVVVPFKATLSDEVDYTSSEYDQLKARCADDGTWKKTTNSEGSPSGTPQLMARLYSATVSGDDDDCFYLNLSGGLEHPSTKDAMYGVGTAFKADIKTLETITTDLSQCGLVKENASADMPTFTVFVDTTPFFGFDNYECGYDEDFEWDANADQEKTYCADAIAQYQEGLLNELEFKWSDSTTAKMQDGLQQILSGILQTKDITEAVTWNSVSYSESGIKFTLTHTREGVGKCK